MTLNQKLFNDIKSSHSDFYFCIIFFDSLEQEVLVENERALKFSIKREAIFGTSYEVFVEESNKLQFNLTFYQGLF